MYFALGFYTRNIKNIKKDSKIHIRQRHIHNKAQFYLKQKQPYTIQRLSSWYTIKTVTSNIKTFKLALNKDCHIYCKDFSFCVGKDSLI